MLATVRHQSYLGVQGGTPAAEIRKKKNDRRNTMNKATANNINNWLIKLWKHYAQVNRSPSGFGETLEHYFRFFCTTPEKLAAVIKGLKARIAVNNWVAVSTSSNDERSSYCYASSVMSELIRRLQGDIPDYRILPA
jgi:hypothetical protein